VGERSFKHYERAAAAAAPLQIPNIQYCVLLQQQESERAHTMAKLITAPGYLRLFIFDTRAFGPRSS